MQESIYQFQTAVSRRLLMWSVPSVAAGALLLMVGPPVLNGVGLQGVIWGGIDGILAAVGMVLARRRRAAPPDEAREVRDRVKFRRLLRVNGWLDVLYVAAGVALAFWWRHDPFILGNGIGITVQGLFLLGFDHLHANALPADTPAWYDRAL